MSQLIRGSRHIKGTNLTKIYFFDGQNLCKFISDLSRSTLDALL